MSDPASRTPAFDRAGAAYDDVLVPAFFDAWAAEVARRLGPPAGMVIDIGCGTGVLAPHLAATGWSEITGMDLSEGMLARARARGIKADWLVADATDIPLPAGVAGAATSSFTLMFIPRPADALREMARVTRPGAPIVVSTWGSLDDIPAIAMVCDALGEVGGEECTSLLRTAFSMGDDSRLLGVAHDAGLDDATVSTHEVTARFPGIAEIARAYATPLGIGDESKAGELEAALGGRLAPWTADGVVTFGMTGLILEARGRGGE